MAQWDTSSVKNIIRDIKENIIVLPVIQRRLVWQEEKMELLFNSLLRGNSFGSIICIEEEKGEKPLFAYREFTRDGNNIDSIEIEVNTHTHLFVIDGQQRLQSFYMGLDGSYNGKILFFDLLSDFEHGEFDFRFAVTANELPSNNNDRLSDGGFAECLWYPASNLFKELCEINDVYMVAENICERLKIDNPVKIRCIERNISKFHSSIFVSDSVGISKIIINKKKSAVENRQNIVELFRRLNDGGTRLSSYDLLASTLKGFDFKMEKFLDDLVSEYSDMGFTEDVIIKLILILSDKPVQEITDITQEDGLFATNNFDRIRNSIEATKRFLIISKNYYWFCTSKKRPVTPLYFMVYHIFYSDVKTEDIPNMFKNYDTNDIDTLLMAQWLRISLLNKVFSNGSGWIPYKTGIRKIHHVLCDCKGKPFPYNRIINVYINHPIHNFSTKIDKESILHFDTEYMLFMLYGDKKKIRSEDIDHIHPKSILKRIGVSEEKINCIINYQLIESGVNRNVKRNKELYIWLNNNINPENLKNYICRNYIPQNEKMFHSENYELFYNARSEIIIHILNKRFEKI